MAEKSESEDEDLLCTETLFNPHNVACELNEAQPIPNQHYVTADSNNIYYEGKSPILNFNKSCIFDENNSITKNSTNNHHSDQKHSPDNERNSDTKNSPFNSKRKSFTNYSMDAEDTVAQKRKFTKDAENSKLDVNIESRSDSKDIAIGDSELTKEGSENEEDLDLLSPTKADFAKLGATSSCFKCDSIFETRYAIIFTHRFYCCRECLPSETTREMRLVRKLLDLTRSYA